MNPVMYAVICPYHGRQTLSRDQYDAALDHPDDPWRCPVCGGVADWDDDCGIMQETGS